MKKALCSIDNRYIIYSDGRVYSTICNRFLKQFINTQGYYVVRIQRKDRFVHRLVATAFHPNPKKLPYVNHKDGNKLNNHYKNLEWCTASYNVSHAYRIGMITVQKGSSIASSKLTENEVRQIKRLLREKRIMQIHIASAYNVSHKTINRISTGKYWKHI